MNDIIAKISSYDILTNLIPGAVLAFLLSVLGLYSVQSQSVIADLLIYYFMGLVVSRIGSLIIEPALKGIGFIRYAEYTTYVAASSRDDKIPILLEVNNQYRTMLSVLVVVSCAYFGSGLMESYNISPGTVKGLLIMALSLLFLMAYRKQTTYIRRRVELRAKEGASDRSGAA